VSALPACTLCGDRLEAGAGPRVRHLRAEHPSTFRALILRLVTPWLYLVVVLSFLASSLPAWVPIVALVAALAGGFALRRRVAMGSGDASRPSPGQLLRAGGYGAIALFALLSVVVALSRG